MFWLTPSFVAQWLALGVFRPQDGISLGTRVTSFEAVGKGPWIIVNDPPENRGWLDDMD